ncbi:MAG: hypothetical protein EXS31_04570 [Pedosphaera sp.]|nr:hypothetical protein [Pedosphaera sp.]
MPSLNLNPASIATMTCFAALRRSDDAGVSHESAATSAFHTRIASTAEKTDAQESSMLLANPSSSVI